MIQDNFTQKGTFQIINGLDQSQIQMELNPNTPYTFEISNKPQ